MLHIITKCVQVQRYCSKVPAHLLELLPLQPLLASAAPKMIQALPLGCCLAAACSPSVAAQGSDGGIQHFCGSWSQVCVADMHFCLHAYLLACARGVIHHVCRSVMTESEAWAASLVI